jgi:hypothetical protein
MDLSTSSCVAVKASLSSSTNVDSCVSMLGLCKYSIIGSRVEMKVDPFSSNVGSCVVGLGISKLGATTTIG